MKYLRLVLVFSILIPAVLFADNDKKILQTFAELDRSFIPVFIFTAENNSILAKKAFVFLKSDWEEFVKNYSAYKSKSQDPEWITDIKSIKEIIALVDKRLYENNEQAAYQLLLTMRFHLANMRLRNGMEYQLDYINMIYEPLEEFDRYLDSIKSEKLTEKHLINIKQLSNEVIDAWHKIVAMLTFEDQTYRLSDAQKQELWKAFDTMKQVLNQLREAIAKNNHSDILKYAKLIKPAYYKILMIFGDFERLKY